MLIDTHCHVNMMVKKNFDVDLDKQELLRAQNIQKEAFEHNISIIINVGTSVIESKNCILLAQTYSGMYCAVGIHPNDCTQEWKSDFQEIKNLLKSRKEHTIVAIGETGLDRHYSGYNIMRQTDAFKAHIELALEHDLPLIIHTRDAHDEVLKILNQYKNEHIRGVIHCFSETLSFAYDAFNLNFVIGIGGTLTYPKNEPLREIIKHIPLEKIILETDAPFLPPQIIRGEKNHPKYIEVIAKFLAELRNIPYETVVQTTTTTALNLFALKNNFPF